MSTGNRLAQLGSFYLMAWAWKQDVPPLHRFLLVAAADGRSVKGLSEATGIPLAETGITVELLRERGFLDDDLLPAAPIPESTPVPGKRTLPKDLRQAIFERDEFTCRGCGATDDLSIDHVYPESLGGSDDPGNLQTLGRACNSSKGARP